jgi:4-diphosphocytidyl-2C-methyl-D-erythritol kinase
MELNDDERALVLAGLFELWITHLEDDVLWAEIAAVAEKLGGDVGAMFFGAAVR